MESDNTVALGLPETTRDRMYKASDAFTFYFCKKCQNKAEANRMTRFQYCKYCDSKEFVREVDMCFTTGFDDGRNECYGYQDGIRIRRR